MGTQIHDARMDDDRLQWCAFPDGTRHGPSIRVNSAGSILEEGAWSMGSRDGMWRRFDSDGTTIAAGRFALGERTGSWMNTEPSSDWSLGRYFSVLQPPEDPISVEAGNDWLSWALRMESMPVHLLPVEDSLLVYTEESVSGVRMDTGEPIFQISLPSRPRAEILYENQRVAFLTEDGAVTLIDIDDGRMMEMMPSDAITGLIAMNGDIVVVRDRAGVVSAVDVDLGRRIWNSSGPWGRVGPLFVGGVLIGVQGEYLHQISTETGLRGWRTRLGDRLVELVPGFDGQRVMAMDRDGGVYAIDAESGELLWSNSDALLERVRRGALIRDDQDGLWVFNGTEILRFDHDSGELLDRSSVESDVVDRVDVLDHLMCSQQEGFGLSCHDIDGRFGWSLELDVADHAPLVSDRIILSIQEDERVLAIDRLGARVAGDIDSDVEIFFGEMELMRDPVWWTGEGDEFWSGTSFDVEWVETRDHSDDCRESIVYLDVASGRGREAVGHEVLLGGLLVESTELDAEFHPLANWEIDSSWETWQVDLLGQWLPVITNMSPFQSGDEWEIAAQQMMDCELESLEYEGFIELVYGLRHARYDGWITLERVDTSESREGCLIELFIGEDSQFWSSPTLEGEVWLRLLGAGSAPVAAVDTLLDDREWVIDENGLDAIEVWAGDETLLFESGLDPDEALVWEAGELSIWSPDSASGSDLVALGIGELRWPEGRAEVLRSWDADLFGVVPEPDERGLVPVVRVSSCLEDGSQ